MNSNTFLKLVSAVALTLVITSSPAISQTSNTNDDHEKALKSTQAVLKNRDEIKKITAPRS